MIDTTQITTVESHIRVTAKVKPEAIAFFREHGCTIQPQPYSDIVIFPHGSQQEPLSVTSKRCSSIILPDGIRITAIDCFTRFIFLILNPDQGVCIHLST